VYYKVLKNNHYTSDYNYYLFLISAEISLYEEYQTGVTNWWYSTGYDDLWLNAGIQLRTDVNALTPSAALFEYSPAVGDLQEYSYTTSTTASVDFGLTANSEGVVTTSLGGGISATSSTSWVTDGRSVENFSITGSGIAKTVYKYDVLENYDWQTLYDFGSDNLYDEGMFPLFGDSIVPDPDLIQSFQQTIVEKQSFVVKVPKYTTLCLNLGVYYVQIYFDETFWAGTTYFSVNQKNIPVIIGGC